MAGNTRIPKAELSGIYGAMVTRMCRKMPGIVSPGFSAACELPPLAEPSGYLRAPA